MTTKERLDLIQCVEDNTEQLKEATKRDCYDRAVVVAEEMRDDLTRLIADLDKKLNS